MKTKELQQRLAAAPDLLEALDRIIELAGAQELHRLRKLVQERDRALRDILRRFVMVTEPGTEFGLTNMKERKGRCDWYARMRPIREEARQALSESEDG